MPRGVRRPRSPRTRLVVSAVTGTVLVRVALRPLRRVAVTARRVARLPLPSGEVALPRRVPETGADPRTEVGRVATALNRMPDHVHSALDARRRSVTRVRRFVADAGHELRSPSAVAGAHAAEVPEAPEVRSVRLEQKGHGQAPHAMWPMPGAPVPPAWASIRPPTRTCRSLRTRRSP